MVLVMNAEEQRVDLVRVVLQEGLDLRRVWAEYAALSGSVAEKDLMAYALGGLMLPRRERDLITLAVQRLLCPGITDLGNPTAPADRRGRFVLRESTQQESFSLEGLSTLC